MNDNANIDFKFLMISAGFEHGGNVTQRFLDGHESLYVYPFESQLGNRHFNDYLSSLERFQYRYPEFPSGLSFHQLYELFYDEELKTLLRKPNGTKFKNADLKMDEKVRIEFFGNHLKDKALTRKNIVAAFFKATFDAWTNYKTSGKNEIYVGYSPIIGIDAPRILMDFPDGHIVHVVRNPFSAYSDTKKRPFPLPFQQYICSWNLYHHIVLMHQQHYPENITIIRYEDLVDNSQVVMERIAAKIGIAFKETMLHPSWNGMDLTNNIYPWGTIVSATSEANLHAISELNKDEKQYIKKTSELLLKYFGYDQLV
ncbi:MAG: sulfotransferase [Pseudomonadota bacterium]